MISNIDELDEPEAKAAVIWIIGQYADRIENSDVFLQDYLVSFHDETMEVKLALLTATVKLFILRPTKGQAIVPQVLKWCTEETDDPDLRDRGYMYWRLLSTDPAAAKDIVMGEKPAITAEREKLDSKTLEELCLAVGTFATVYLKPIHQVFRNARSKKLVPSPALQRPPRDEVVALHTPVAEMSRIQKNPYAASVTTPSSANGNFNAAVDAADMYFAGVGNHQMAAMSIQDGMGSGGGTQYVVNQNQNVYDPQGSASRDLLM